MFRLKLDASFPDVVLLDEIDASLHPSIIKNFFAAIDEMMLSRGVNVIAVMHSPTTVALAPENSVFVMHRSGPKRIMQSSKSAALEILTEGFATLEEGLRLFDSPSRERARIFTEGRNTRYIKRALEFYDIKDVEVVTAFESKSGQSQLKTLYDFLSALSQVR